MSDTRFTMIGVGLIFAGFMVMSIFGAGFFANSIESQEFEDCYEYFEDKPPVEVSCDVKLQDKTMFFALVIGLIISGIIALLKGVRGKWDQDVKPEDMVGPGGNDSVNSDKKESD